MTKVLILGVDGQDGSFLAENSLNKNYKVIGIGRQDKPKWLISNNIQYIKCDLEKPLELKHILEKENPSAIYHAAAIHGSAGFAYEDNFYSVHMVNVVSVNVILEYLKKIKQREGNNKKFIFISSTKVFNDSESIINEDTEKKNISLYEISKNNSEHIINYYRKKYNLNVNIIWTSNHESVRRSDQFFIPKVACSVVRALKNNDKTIFDNLDFYADWGDADEFMKLILEINDDDCNDYILATGNTVNAKELVKEIFKEYKLNYMDYINYEKNEIKSIQNNIVISKFINSNYKAPQINVRDILIKIINNKMGKS